MKKKYSLHGLSHHPIYKLFKSIEKRCHIPSSTSYEVYGGRGIKVCWIWRKSFITFYNWAIKNGWQKDLEIDRKDNNGNYTPFNCQFITRRENLIKRNKGKNNTSGYIGIHKCLRYKNPQWQAQITVKGKYYWIGSYPTIIEAIDARDDFIIENQLKGYPLNFPNRRLKLMAKGGNFEGEISKELSLYLTHMRTEDGVWKTEGSGGRVTCKAKANMETRMDQYGDITYTIPETKFWFDVFSVECKTGYAKKTKDKTKTKTTLTHWSLLDMIDSSQKLCQFHEFWEQSLNDAIGSKREPILIFRRNRRNPCIALHNDIVAGFMACFGMPTMNYLNLKTMFDPLAITVMNMRHFFDWTEQINHHIIRNHIVKQILKRKFKERIR